MLIGVGQIGCSPNELAQGSPDGSTCVQKINDANQLFNSRLRSLVDDLNNNNDDAKFIYINAYGIFQDIVTSPSSFGKCVKYQKSIDFFYLSTTIYLYFLIYLLLYTNCVITCATLSFSKDIKKMK